MSHALPLPLPAWLVDHFRVDLSLPHAAGWGVDVVDVTAASTGDVYALYGVHRFLDNVAADEQDPALVRFGYRLLTRYSPDGVPLATALFWPVWAAGDATAVAAGAEMTLCVLPDGTLSLNAHPDRSTLVSPDLSTVLATYKGEGRHAFEEFVPGNPFAGSIGTTPSGRLLCTTSEYGVHGYGDSLPNIVGVADGALTAESKPVIRAIASLDPEPARHIADDLRPHVRFGDGPVGMANRPRPALTEIFAEVPPWGGWDESRLARPAALADDLFVVPFFGRTYRAGSKGQPFVFALLDDEGAVRGSLGGMDFWKDSPFTGFCFTVVADAARGRVFHLNRYGLYAWDRDGRARGRLDTTAKEYKPLTRFVLKGVSASGELLLMHEKQRLVLRVPVPDDLDGLGPAVETALRGFAAERAALKKQWNPVAWHWIQPDLPLHRL